MILTFILSVLMMTGLFLMLLGGVGFIQDKRFFTSARSSCFRCLGRDTGRVRVLAIRTQVLCDAHAVESI